MQVRTGCELNCAMSLKNKKQNIQIMNLIDSSKLFT